jgi:hypothetical protein
MVPDVMLLLLSPSAPDDVIAPQLMVPTVMFGVPVKPVAVPVKAPDKLLAYTFAHRLPEAPKLYWLSEFGLCVPDVMLLLLSPSAPDDVIAPQLMVPTAMFGVPVKPVALPDNAPVKVIAYILLTGRFDSPIDVIAAELEFEIVVTPAIAPLVRVIGPRVCALVLPAVMAPLAPIVVAPAIAPFVNVIGPRVCALVFVVVNTPPVMATLFPAVFGPTRSVDPSKVRVLFTLTMPALVPVVIKEFALVYPLTVMTPCSP